MKFNNYKNKANSAMNSIVKNKIMDMAKTMIREGNGKINSDAMGSYTGIGNKGERPIQDADDL